MIDEFRQRAVARLQLLPPHDPQFRRNRERVARDAEREHLILEWDLGYDEDDLSAALASGVGARSSVVAGVLAGHHEAAPARRS